MLVPLSDTFRTDEALSEVNRSNTFCLTGAKQQENSKSA